MVEITPKSFQKEAPITGFLFYLSILFLAIVLIVYFIFFSLQKKSEATLQEIQEKLEKGKTDEILFLEKKIKNYASKIKEITPLLNEHVFATKFLKELETRTHPKLFFQKNDLNLSGSTVTLDGQTDNFFTLGQQILNLEENPLISELKLEKVSINKEGRVEFTLKFNFNPTITK